MKDTLWSDVQLHGFAWTPDGRDVVLDLELPPSVSDRRRRLACRWAHGVTVQLEFPRRHGGFPLTWNATFTELDDGTWRARFDFASCGEIRLECNEFEFLPGMFCG